MIQFLLEDASLANRWRAALSRDDRFQLEPDEPANHARAQRGEHPPHVLIVGQNAALNAANRRWVRRGAMGVIYVCETRLVPHESLHPQSGGCEGTAQSESADETLLPADVTDREIVLVCRLVGENARLRRRVRRDHRQRRRLAKLADTDPLTGLLNRRAWQRELRACAGERAAAGVGHCLVVVDIDHLKRINDGHGYAAGDRVLVQAAEALRRGARGGDSVARLGGDEFGVLLTNIAEQAAAMAVERLRRCVSSVELPVAETVTASAGYAWFTPTRQADDASILAAADQALRAAKAAGRDQAVAYEAGS